MEPADPEVAAYIAQWRPSSLSPQAAAFARAVIGQVAPEGRERAKNLLWAAGKLADYAIPLGLEPVPEVVLHPSTAERFTRRAPGLSGVARLEGLAVSGLRKLCFLKPLPAIPGTRCGPPAEACTRSLNGDAFDCSAVRCSAQYHVWPFRGSDRLCDTRAPS